MTGKTAACYDSAFHLLKTDLGGAFRPSVIGIDFERNFIKMCKKHWPRAVLIGCFFHFKQALRRNLKDKLKIPDNVVSYLMERGMLDLAAVLPADDVRSINSKGWLFIARLIAAPSGDTDVDKWMSSKEGKIKIAEFFAYVDKFWTAADILPLWNWSAFLELEEDVRPRFRTNCWMENYNGRWGREFSVPHPRLQVFVEVLQKEHARINALLDHLRKEHADPVVYGTPDWPKIPEEYDEFEVPSKKSLKRANLATHPDKVKGKKLKKSKK